MAYSKLEKLIIEMAMPIAEANECYIYDVEYVKEGGARYLRVFADKEESGISINECEIINRALGEELDKHDPIKETYILEVASPGIERKLRTPGHFEKYTGRTVDVGLYQAIDGSKSISGVLKKYENDTIVIDTGEKEVLLSLKDTTFVKLHFDF